MSSPEFRSQGPKSYAKPINTVGQSFNPTHDQPIVTRITMVFNILTALECWYMYTFCLCVTWPLSLEEPRLGINQPWALHKHPEERTRVRAVLNDVKRLTLASADLPSPHMSSCCWDGKLPQLRLRDGSRAGQSEAEPASMVTRLRWLPHGSR